MYKPITALLVCLPVFAAPSDRWKFDEHQQIAKTFNVTSSGSGGPKLLVDNVTGPIHVTGYGGSEVKVSADMHFRAETTEAMSEAKREVKLDMNQQGNFARVYLDGPFRKHDEYRGERYYGYNVEVSFEIQVPMSTEVILKTVNGGSLVLKNTTGDFDIRHVNGGVTLDQVSGSGSVNSVNGPLDIHFTRNPTKASSFTTVNGKIDVYFQPTVAADFSFQTLNGEIFSDFDLSPLPSAAGSVEQKEGKFIYKSKRMSGGRAGRGGPELSFKTVNGGIRLHSK